MVADEPGPDPVAAAASLRALLEAIDAGEVEATDAQRSYFAGAADMAERLALRSDER